MLPRSSFPDRSDYATATYPGTGAFQRLLERVTAPRRRNADGPGETRRRILETHGQADDRGDVEGGADRQRARPEAHAVDHERHPRRPTLQALRSAVRPPGPHGAQVGRGEPFTAESPSLQ